MSWLGALWHSIPVLAALSAVPAGSFGCEAVLGLGGETALPDASSDAGGPDARSDAKPDRARPPDALGPRAAVFVSSGSVGSDWCVVTENGDLYCWGNNESGELGDGTTRPSATPVRVELNEPVASVSVGSATVCAVTRAGGVYCWGDGLYGELGNGQMQSSSTPVLVPGLDGITAVSTANYTVCAVDGGGALFCWGAGLAGELGNAGTANSATPLKVPALSSGVTSVSVGESFVCATQRGAVLCWGGLYGANEPGKIGGFTDAIARVSLGDDFACGLTTRGGVQCWGNGDDGTLGNGQIVQSSTAVQVRGLTSGVTEISAGAASVSAIRSDGTVVTWGYAAYGALGNGSADLDATLGDGMGGYSSVPVAVKGLTEPVVSISTGLAPCVATRGGALDCWGITSENALVPVSTEPFMNPAVQVTAGGILGTGQFTCGMSVGNVVCWGANGLGQIGASPTGTPYVTLPTGVNGLGVDTTVVTGGVGGDFTCAIQSGLAYCWGDNSTGQLGSGKAGGHQWMPLPVAGLGSSTLSVSAGSQSACAIVASAADAGADGGPDGGPDGGMVEGGPPGGAVYCWGGNNYGQLGIGSGGAALHPKPVRVKGLGSGVTAIAVGALTACALLADGAVVCWGNDSDGELGDGDPLDKQQDSPTAVVGLSGPVTNVSVGWYSACAVLASGGVECWGSNLRSELGTDTEGGTSVNPVAVVTASGAPLTGATQVSVGSFSACAVASGDAYCWGTGPIGDNSPPGLSYPFASKVTGIASVSQVAVGDDYACANVSGVIWCWGYNHQGALGNNGAVDEFVPARVAGFP